MCRDFIILLREYLSEYNLFIFQFAEEAKKKYGEENIKIYKSKFTNMYYSVTSHRPPTATKLVCLKPEEKVSVNCCNNYERDYSHR